MNDRDGRIGEEHIYAIGNAILKLRRAFIDAGISPPVSIELGDWEAGDKLRCYIPRELFHAQARMTDKPDPEWACNIMGMEVRYPGRWRDRERGGRDFI